MGQTLMMYADDFACICKSEEELQQAINICKKCVDYFSLTANVSKSTGMQIVENDSDLCKTNFTWGPNGDTMGQIPNDKENSYPYLGIKLHYQLKWDDTITKNEQKTRQAHAECLNAYKDLFLDPDIKLMFFRMKEVSSNKYAIELVSHTKKECEECDKTQMKNLKCALNLRRSNHNTLIRLMTAEYRFQTIKTVRTLNLIRKLRKQPDEKLPPEIINHWDQTNTKYELIAKKCGTNIKTI